MTVRKQLSLLRNILDMMKCRVFGEQTNVVVIESGGQTLEFYCNDSIVKLWFSDGTVLGIKYGKHSLQYPNLWKIRIINQGKEKYVYKQCFTETLLYNSDTYETEAELVDYEVIPRTYYVGDDLT
jgi:hypothetical protein